MSLGKVAPDHQLPGSYGNIIAGAFLLLRRCYKQLGTLHSLIFRPQIPGHLLLLLLLGGRLATSPPTISFVSFHLHQQMKVVAVWSASTLCNPHLFVLFS